MSDFFIEMKNQKKQYAILYSAYVISGFIFRRKNGRKKKRKEKGATEMVFLPPVTPAAPFYHRT